MANAYVQVALTYVRRLFSSWFARLATVMFVCMLIGFSSADRTGNLKDSAFVQIMAFFSFFILLALHMKGQFADSRAHLMPGYRRVHATIAAAAAIVFAVILPAALSWFMGWHSIGFVAAVVLLFGVVLWLAVKDSKWLWAALMVGWATICSARSGQTYFRDLICGQIELQAVVILGLGALLTLLAGIRLVRLSEETPGYGDQLSWGWERSRRTHQTWSDEPGIRRRFWDWISERQTARLTRHARRASVSPWSRICRWQVGMVAGWSLWFWVLPVAIYVDTLPWWFSSASSAAAAADARSVALTLVPLVASIGAFGWQIFGRELVLPVERKTYIRQLGIAARAQPASIVGCPGRCSGSGVAAGGPASPSTRGAAKELTISAAIQIAIFGVVAWTARY